MKTNKFQETIKTNERLILHFHLEKNPHLSYSIQNILIDRNNEQCNTISQLSIIGAQLIKSKLTTGKENISMHTCKQNASMQQRSS